MWIFLVSFFVFQCFLFLSAMVHCGTPRRMLGTDRSEFASAADCQRHCASVKGCILSTNCGWYDDTGYDGYDGYDGLWWVQTFILEDAVFHAGQVWWPIVIAHCLSMFESLSSSKTTSRKVEWLNATNSKFQPQETTDNPGDDMIHIYKYNIYICHISIYLDMGWHGGHCHLNFRWAPTSTNGSGDETQPLPAPCLQFPLGKHFTYWPDGEMCLGSNRLDAGFSQIARTWLLSSNDRDAVTPN